MIEQNVKEECDSNGICKTNTKNMNPNKNLLKYAGEKKYKCPSCDMKFSHILNRNRHVQKHRAHEDGDNSTYKSLFTRKQIGGTEWLCTHCNLTFDNFSLLNLHTLTHAAENVSMIDGVFGTDSNSSQTSCSNTFNGDQSVEEAPLKCPQCTEEFVSKKDLILHASVHGKVIRPRKAPKPFKCELCYKSFAADDRLQKHMMVHGSEDAKPLQCTICTKRFLNNSALACHIKIHSNEKKVYGCPICKEIFHQITNLKEHVYIHYVDGVFTCPSCNKKFLEYNQVRKHVRVFHSDKRFPCEHCEKVFQRPDKLKLHMLRHSDHREFLCANCGKQFKRKDKLKEHMKRMHSADREMQIKVKAPKRTSSKKFIPKVSPTDYHRFIYKCHDCLLGFKRRGMLVNHLAKRHPEIRPESVPELNLPILKTTRDYYCQYCNKVYKSSSKRKAHILKNHPGSELPMSNRRKGGVPEIPGVPNPTFSQTVGSITTFPHHCDWCHKQYASKAKLLQHQRKKHNDMVEVAFNKPMVVQQDVPAQLESIIVNSAQLGQRTLELEPAQVIENGTNEMLIATNKGKVSLLSTSIPLSRLQYIDRDNNIITNVPTTDSAQASDLLTQAMSELTQSIEFRNGTATDAEYLQLVTNTSTANSGVLGLKVISTVPDGSIVVPHQVTSCVGNVVSHEAGANNSTMDNSLLGNLLTRPYVHCPLTSAQSSSISTQTPVVSQILIENDGMQSAAATSLNQLIGDSSSFVVKSNIATLHEGDAALGIQAVSSDTSLPAKEEQTILVTISTKSNAVVGSENTNIVTNNQAQTVNDNSWSAASYDEFSTR
ncbi:PR domain zinc finger protein 10 [Nymphon striatum]|nr:PR domain zinc finger protein 10 [Nymphon striatum]